MAVTETCPVPGGAVTVNVAKRQQLRYTITGDQVNFKLRDQDEKTLLPTPAGERIRLWPVYPDEVPTPDEVGHGLGMVFGPTEKLEWLVELLDSAGAPIRTVLHCKFSNDATPTEFFEGLTIFIKRVP